MYETYLRTKQLYSNEWNFIAEKLIMISLFITLIHLFFIVDFVYPQTVNNEIIIGYSDKSTHIVTQNQDSYQIIQQSLDQLKSKGGGILRFEKGLYILSQNIEIGSNTAMIGAGINDTTLKLMDNAKPWWEPAIGLRKSGFLRSKKTKNLYFANFTIDGNKQNQGIDEISSYGRYGLYTEAADNVVVDSMGVVNFQGYGFDPHGIKSGVWSNGLVIVNSYAANNDWDGYTIDQSTNVFLQNNIAYNNGRHGYNFVTGTYNVIMYNNIAIENGYSYYLGNPGCGVAIQNNLYFGTRNISILNNFFQDDFDAGICVRDVADITIKNNKIANLDFTNTSSHLCIELFNTTNVVSDNNVCNKTLPVNFKSLPLIITLPSIPSTLNQIQNQTFPSLQQKTSSSGHFNKYLSLLTLLSSVTIAFILIV